MQATLERLQERRERGDEGGFTLIELLIVIVILGILAAIVVFAVQNLTSSSVQSACRADFKTVQTAAEAYKAQMGAYPTGKTDTGTQASVSPVAQTAAGAPSATDVDAVTAPAFTDTVAPLGVNAAGATTGAGSEMLTGSNIYKTTEVGGSGQPTSYTDDSGNLTQNMIAPSTDMTVAIAQRQGVGPWLKSLPKSNGHYTIWLANNGSGQIAVVDANGKAIKATNATNAYGDAAACALVK